MSWRLPATLTPTIVLAVIWILGWGPGPVLADVGESKVFGSIDVGAGQHAGDLTTVNGGIHIGENATVGHAGTVNGGIIVAARASAGPLTAVNGPIHLGDGARVNGSVHTVNGGLKVGKGSDVHGTLINVNGDIEIAAAHISGVVETVEGNIDVGANAQLDGGIYVQKNQGVHFGVEPVPRIVIGPGAVVKGQLRFERKVKLYVSDRATIGPVEGATPVKFSGDFPKD